MKKIINILFNKAKSFIRIVRIELDLRFGIPYNYFGKKIFASKQKYLEIFEVAKNEKFKNIDLFEESNSYKIDRNWLDTLALHTQVLIKSSKINYQHGRVLYTSLCKYLKDNDDITILETGTARGFSALCMSKALSDYKKIGKIFTIDILPHNKKMIWNCIDDIEGPKSREELLNPWSNNLQNIEFIRGKSNKVLKKLNLNRVNFCFLDAVHNKKYVQAEFEFVSNRQNIGDIIIFDDITQNQFPDLVKYILSIENDQKYKFEYLKSTDSRGYAIAKKTK